MRHVSRGLFVIVGPLLIIAASELTTRGDEAAGTLVFRQATLPQPVVHASTPPIAEPVPAVPQSPPQFQPPQTAPTQTAPPQPAASTPTPAFPSIGANPSRPLGGHYAGYSARAALSQLPRRAPIQTSPPRPVRRPSKPFEVIHREPTVSPYLNLYREEDDEQSAPNYFAFVRPQMEQIEANRLQQREIQQLRGQLNNMSSTVVGPRYESTGLPATGGAARYMDTAQFYGGWRR